MPQTTYRRNQRRQSETQTTRGRKMHRWGVGGGGGRWVAIICFTSNWVIFIPGRGSLSCLGRHLAALLVISIMKATQHRRQHQF